MYSKTISMNQLELNTKKNINQHVMTDVIASVLGLLWIVVVIELVYARYEPEDVHDENSYH
jgi:VanZ family protein